MQSPISRRSFVQRSAGALAAASVPALVSFPAAAAALPEATAAKLPRWRGFNLLQKFNGQNQPFDEKEFAWIAEMGFNFVRLPMDYRAWIEGGDWTKLRETTLKDIDLAVGYGEKHGVHVNINFHRAPGYTVAQPPEAKPVWSDAEALAVCTQHWAHFAKRYAGIPSTRVSFNLFNEPGRLEPATYRRVVQHLVEAIRQHDAKRLVICDGRDWGNAAPTELAGLGVAAATRGYQPMRISHYLASWVGNAGQGPVPTHPLTDGQTVWNRDYLRERQIEPWKKLQAQGVGVMVGEFGAFNKTPHAVVLAWLKDCLGLWKEAGWGWALWNFRSSFGILDSGRADVTYDQWHGVPLDRALLELLQAS